MTLSELNECVKIICLSDKRKQKRICYKCNAKKNFISTLAVKDYQTVQYVAFEVVQNILQPAADNVCLREERKPHKRLVLQLATTLASVILAVCVILLFASRGGKGLGSVTTLPSWDKIYRIQDVMDKRIDMKTYLWKTYYFLKGD